VSCGGGAGGCSGRDMCVIGGATIISAAASSAATA